MAEKTVEDGALVRVEFEGKVKQTGKIFDTTDEDVAKKEGIYNKDAKYGPHMIVFGKGQMLPGLEEKVKGMNEGEEKEIELGPKDAFGERKKDLVRVMPAASFRKQGLNPTPGMVVSLDNQAATIKSINSGRVVVDFNHPLAGEDVVYRMKVNEVIAEPRKMIESLLEAHELKAEYTIDNGLMLITFKDASNEPDYVIKKKGFLENVKQYVPTIKEVKVQEDIKMI